MRILLIHNRYQQAGGEDTVFNVEGELLNSHGHSVERLVFDNKDIRTWYDKILSGIYLIYNPVSAKRMTEKIIRYNPDVIHVHNFVPLASPSIFFVAKKFRKPVVLTLHNFRLLCPSTILFYDNKIYEKSIKKFFPLDAIIKGVYRGSSVQTAALVVMTLVHKIIGTWHKRIDKYIVLTNFALSKFKDSTLGIKPDQFVMKSNFVQQDNHPEGKRENFFLFVGRLSEEKGIRTLLESTRIFNFNLTIIGDGPLKSIVEQRAADNPNIQYLGFQERSVISGMMKRCKALIFPSVCYEGVPMTILEAFSTGTPVIASRLGSMVEIVQDNFSGLHFEAGNESDLAEKLKTMMLDDSLAERLSLNARKTYDEKYTPEKNYQELIGIYRQAIKRANNEPS